jgi:pseudaminic acid cytidylyltransferase
MKYNKKPICIIPARGGSKRIKNKNIKKFYGKPIIAHAINLAKKTNIFQKIVVSTDSLKIKKIAIKYGAEVPFLRSKNLSNDYSGTKEVIIDCIKKIKSENIKYHFCLYPTSPLIKSKDIKESFKKIKKLNYDFLIALSKFNYSPLRALTVNKNKISYYFKKYIKKRSQDLPVLMQDTGTFYIYNTNKLIKKNKKKIIPIRSTYYEISKERALDINDHQDFEFAKKLYKIT